MTRGQTQTQEQLESHRGAQGAEGFSGIMEGHKHTSPDNKELFSKASNELKAYLIDEFPQDFFFEDGWYTKKKFPQFLMYLKDGQYSYGFSSEGEWFEGSYELYPFEVEHDELADETSVYDRLKRESIQRGIFFNSKIVEHANQIEVCHSLGLNSGDFGERYIASEDYLYNINGCVYSKGNWSELFIEEVTVDPSVLNRAEIIDKSGRVYTSGVLEIGKIEVQLQDQGRTLKIFINKNKQ